MNDDSLNSGINWFELDRLVDGQLAPHEYRELLRQIDKDPDGWRQCALAFLQHQAIEKEMKAMGGFPPPPAAMESSLPPGDDSIELASKNIWSHKRNERRSPFQRVGGLTLGIVGACAAAMVGISAGSYLRSHQPPSTELASTVPFDGLVTRAYREPVPGDPVANVASYNGISYPRSFVSHSQRQESVLGDDPHLCGRRIREGN